MSNDEDFIDLTGKDNEKIKNIDGLFFDLTANDPDGNADGSDLESDEDVEHNRLNSTYNLEDRVRDKSSQNYLDPLPSFEETPDIPSTVYWESILASLENSESGEALLKRAVEIKSSLPPIRQRSTDVSFDPETDYIDATATYNLPSDGPKDVHAIWTLGDGNCLVRALSRAYIGNSSMYLELRARIALEAILNRPKYITDFYLQKGGSKRRRNENLPEVYVQYSDYYVNGQRITDNTVEYIYAREINDCCKTDTYMGLWQLAQAASVLGCTIQSVYPQGGDPLMRLDFHRHFIPVLQNKPNEDSKIMIMWTGIRKGEVPCHFVPLVPKKNKYFLDMYNLNFVNLYVLFTFSYRFCLVKGMTNSEKHLDFCNDCANSTS